jgi:GGDEF domain-containing protein
MIRALRFKEREVLTYVSLAVGLLLLPGADRAAAAAMAEAILELLKINNQFHSNAPLSISMGVATGEDGETIEALMKRADRSIYEHKRAFYKASGLAQRSTRGRRET